MTPKVHYNWEDIDMCCSAIVQSIKDSKWQPDYIIGLARGGLVPATIMSHALNVPLHAIKFDLKQSPFIENVAGLYAENWLARDAALRFKILIVDDINDTGATINYIKDKWAHEYTSNWSDIWHNSVRVATLVNNKASKATVDYSHILIDKSVNDCWIVYPWEQRAP